MLYIIFAVHFGGPSVDLGVELVKDRWLPFIGGGIVEGDLDACTIGFFSVGLRMDVDEDFGDLFPVLVTGEGTSAYSNSVMSNNDFGEAHMRRRRPIGFGCVTFFRIRT